MGDLPPVQWLRSFEAAARHLSFTRAAEELHITQSAVSQQVKLLEHSLGLALFIRQPRSLALTEAGHLYLPNVQNAFETLRHGTRLLSHQDRTVTLELRANWAFSVNWLISRLQQFLSLHPEIEVNLSTELWSSGHTSIKHGVEVRYGLGDWAAARLQQLTSEVCYPVCSPELAARISRPEDLLNHTLIHVRGLKNQQWEDWFQHAGIKGEHRARSHSTTTFIVALEMAKQSIGAVIGHDLVCRSLLASGQLVKPFDITLPTVENYYLLTYGQVNHAVKAFEQWLTDTLVRDGIAAAATG